MKTFQGMVREVSSIRLWLFLLFSQQESSLSVYLHNVLGNCTKSFEQTENTSNLMILDNAILTQIFARIEIMHL